MKKIFFPEESVVELYNALEQLQVKIWLDGGWGVDALLGMQTRKHLDLDIVIQQKDLVIFYEFLKPRNYKEGLCDDAIEWNFVLADDIGQKIDVHVITLDNKGNGIYGPISREIFYPANALLGMGQIGGVTVRCLTAEYQVQSHLGYELKEKDFKDVLALCKKFSITLPREYGD